MAVNGIIYVLDRAAPRPLSRREGSHRRMIHPDTVIGEMKKAGFYLWARGPKPARDRFLLCFGRVPAEELWREIDPLVAGPDLQEPPAKWLEANSWRLRGLRTASGERIYFGKTGVLGHACCGPQGGCIACRLSDPSLILFFGRSDCAFRLLEAKREEKGTRVTPTGPRPPESRSGRPGA